MLAFKNRGDNSPGKIGRGDHFHIHIDQNEKNTINLPTAPQKEVY
jgi:hypothetical protein